MISYWFVSRPKIVEHRDPYLVFDCQDRLYLPLTLFGKDASYRLSQQSVRMYLYAILPFFTWLDTDHWQSKTDISWDAALRQVPHAVEDYLIQKPGLQVQQRQRGFQLVRLTSSSVVGTVLPECGPSQPLSHYRLQRNLSNQIAMNSVYCNAILHISKAVYVESLLALEGIFAEQRERWLLQQDGWLTWQLRAEEAERQ